jgi:hypothetical protein
MSPGVVPLCYSADWQALSACGLLPLVFTSLLIHLQRVQCAQWLPSTSMGLRVLLQAIRARPVSSDIGFLSSFSLRSVSSLLRTSSSSDPQNEVDNNRKQQSNGQDCRTKAIVETTLPSHANALCAPVECDERVDHGHQGDECEESSTDLSDAVTEVEKTDGEAAEDDGEVEP